jgi:hypothetical protein
MVLKRLARKNGVFYTLYIEKEQIAETQNDHTRRKSLGHISLVRALSRRMSIKDRPSLYKIESALKSDKFCCNGWLRKMMFFIHFI